MKPRACDGQGQPSQTRSRRVEIANGADGEDSDGGEAVAAAVAVPGGADRDVVGRTPVSRDRVPASRERGALERLGKHWFRLTDGERRRLAKLGKALGHKALRQVARRLPPATNRRRSATTRIDGRGGPTREHLSRAGPEDGVHFSDGTPAAAPSRRCSRPSGAMPGRYAQEPYLARLFGMF